MHILASFISVPMVTLPSALLWTLLIWLVASDNRIPWLCKKRQTPSAPGSNKKNASDSKAQSKARLELESLHGFMRVAAYAALATLLWSWSFKPDLENGGGAGGLPVHPAAPSFRVEVGKFSSDSTAPQPDGLVEGTTPVEEDTSNTTDTSEEARYSAAIHNETLGFQKIFVVNLPERTDKRDALTLVSALTDIKLTWTSAIRGTNVPDKALPLGVDRNGWRDGGIGSWRSQMNVIRTMVEENIASALILEDDADWDVRLKAQLEAISRGTRILLDMAHEEPAFASKLPPKSRSLDGIDSPYGQGWDILWLGHCGETFPERIPGHHEILDRSSTRYTYYAMENDETLPADPEQVTESWISGDLNRHRGTRWVHFSGGPTCSQGYALSQSGARKILLALSVGGTLVEQLDNAMSHLCRDHTPWDHPDDTQGPPGYPGANMRCLSVNPAVISQHKPRGRKSAGSDIETVEDGDELREEGESPNLVLSARLNVQNLMMGQPLQEQKVTSNRVQTEKTEIDS